MFTIPSLLTGILFVGAVLRIYDLGTESLWIDEAISMLWAKLSLSQIIERAALDIHPPLYFVLLHYWIHLFGASEFAARLLSAIIGIISLFMIYKVGSLVFDHEAGLLSAFIMALSGFHIWYSQDARPYSLLVLTSLLSMYFFIQLHRRRTHRDSIGYIVWSSLLIYTHYFGFFILLAQNIFSCTLSFLKKERIALAGGKWLLLQGLLIVSYLPWSGALMNRLLGITRKATDGVSWIPLPSFQIVKDSLKTYAGSSELMYLFLIFAVFAIAGYRKKQGNPEGCFSNAASICLGVLWFITPVILPLIISYIYQPMFVTRYTIAATPGLYIMTARGIQNTNYAAVKYGIIILIAALSLMNVRHYYNRVDKQQWREAVAYVDANSKTQDKIIFIPGGPVKVQVWDYYSKRRDVIKEPFVLKGSDEDNRNALSTALTGHDRIWFVVSGGKDFTHIYQEALQQSSYHLLSYRRYDGKNALPQWAVIQVILYERRGDGV
jgi:mannosyltransferase